MESTIHAVMTADHQYSQPPSCWVADDRYSWGGGGVEGAQDGAKLIPGLPILWRMVLLVSKI